MVVVSCIYSGKAMLKSTWLFVSINILLSSILVESRTTNRILGDLSAEEGAIDATEKLLEKKFVKQRTSKKSLLLSPQLNFDPLNYNKEDDAPFAVGPSDPRFFAQYMDTASYYPMYEDTPHLNIHYPMHPVHPSMQRQYMNFDLNQQYQQPMHQQTMHQQPMHQQPMHQQPMHQQPMHQQPMHQYPYRPSFYDYYNRQMVGNPVNGFHEEWSPDMTKNHAVHREEQVMSLHGGANGPNLDDVNYMQVSPQYAQRAKFVQETVPERLDPQSFLTDFYFVALVAGCTAAAVCAVIGLGICYYRLNKSKRDASEAEYPAYGVTGPNKDISPGSADRKLAQSAHMYHYQHQKQQMIAAEKNTGEERHCSTSDVDSEEEGDEGHYTVYECPGLAPTGEMEVKNPLFTDEPTPASPGLIEGRAQ